MTMYHYTLTVLTEKRSPREGSCALRKATVQGRELRYFTCSWGCPVVVVVVVGVVVVVVVVVAVLYTHIKFLRQARRRSLSSLTNIYITYILISYIKQTLMKSFYDICNRSMANLGTFPNGLEGLDGTGKYLVMN